MAKGHPRFRGWLQVIVLVALVALVAVYLRPKAADPGKLDFSGRYRLIVDEHECRVERVSDEQVVARGEGHGFVAAWDARRTQCLAWRPEVTGGPATPGGVFWAWQEGAAAPTTLGLDKTSVSMTPGWVGVETERQPRRLANGSPEWLFSPDGKRVAVLMCGEPYAHSGLLVCLHPWQPESREDPHSPGLERQPGLHAVLDGVKGALWKSENAQVLDTSQGAMETTCLVGPSHPEVDPDDATPELSPDGQYKLVGDGKTFLRVQRIKDQSTVWQLKASDDYWHVFPRWHKQQPLLAVCETTTKKSTILHVFTPEKQTTLDLGDLGGEGPLGPPVPSPDGRRVFVLVAPVFGNYDVDCGVATCCHLADRQVHRIDWSPEGYIGPDPEAIRERFPDCVAGLYGTRKADWTSPTGLTLWNVLGFEGSEYLYPMTAACTRAAAPWP